MLDDLAVDFGGTTLPIHAVPKWQWWLLDVGVPVTHHATD
jgi:hypothetical protein